MRMLLLYILLVAFSCQQTTVNGQQTPFLESENLKTSESEKGSEQQTISNEPFLETENLKTSKSEKGQKIFQVFNFSDSQILFYAQKRITTTPSVSPNAMTS